MGDINLGGIDEEDIDEEDNWGSIDNEDIYVDNINDDYSKIIQEMINIIKLVENLKNKTKAKINFDQQGGQASTEVDRWIRVAADQNDKLKK